MTFPSRTYRSARREPAASIIAHFGGDEPTARILDVVRSTVTKFTSPKCHDGEIPRRYRPKLIEASKKTDWILKPEDFAWRPPPEPVTDRQPGAAE